MLAPEGYDYSNNIHLFSMKGLKFALDVNSGAVSVLDDIGFRFLSELVLADGNLEQARRRCLELACPQEIREAEAELQEARDRGYLFTAQEIPCFAFDEMPVKALCLNVAHKCNLRCRYCFAAQGSFGGEEMLMTSEVGQRAVDFLLANCGQVKNLEIDFFGGEPLLNLDVVRDTVRYGKKCADKLGKTINFTLTTNAVLLTEEIMDFLLAEHIALILSLDGRQEVNDACRVSSSGKGSYDLVLPRIQMAVAKNPHSYYVRGTFTKKNLDFGRDLEHLVECGFTNVSLEPAVGGAEGYAIGEADLPRVLQEYEQLAGILWDYYLRGKEVNFFHFNIDFERGPCLAKRVTGCGAGVEYLAVTPKGEIYPCHQFVGNQDYLMGDIYKGLRNTEVRGLFAENQLFFKEDCRTCWARHYCGGGCAANAYFENGDLKKTSQVSCAMQRKRIECAIWLETQKRLLAEETNHNIPR
ncbi:MAG: thioether cross-link-forming SCIFF peptide maturase [Syntrophothermus sp.]|uniref:thioether cross-link-forming SCIFF peptide maturase n=1 Tax=Syntrophothermus sp. TaxID=2736299 RepID=UPI0025811A38|nr:thioether cross-link-forming SCIFF peptide maturase [Syntrophothermus sp.]NSW82117.1 thioether cross-link-forming SCIFF peptide maturase [Syntrophothermus sp.]